MNITQYTGPDPAPPPPPEQRRYSIDLDEIEMLHLAAILYRHEPCGPEGASVWEHLPQPIRRYIMQQDSVSLTRRIGNVGPGPNGGWFDWRTLGETK